jgi:signal transduction histidine kinase
VASQLVSGRTLPLAVRRRELAIDVGVAAAVFAMSLALLGRGGTDPGSDASGLDPLGLLITAAASLPLVARRRAPLTVFAMTAAASVVYQALDYPPGPPIGATVALFFLALTPQATRAPRWGVAAAVGTMFVLHLGAVAVAQDKLPTVPLLFGTLVWGGAWVLGDRLRMRRARIAELEERALRAEREAERERRLAAAEERTRIARDLHDSAGHAINVILVQAGAARLLGERDPDGSRAAIETIEEVARETLGEIDHLVRVLREDELGEDRAVEPPPGFAALETLAERHRSTGLDVGVRAQGSRRPLPPAVDQAAYRIVQEALTNAAKHGAGRAEVDVTFGAHSLELAVRNPVAPGASTDGSGHGIVGMRERAVLLGGTLDAGAANGVFRVTARLPLAGRGR